jgi:hypothetical protein
MAAAGPTFQSSGWANYIALGEFLAIHTWPWCLTTALQPVTSLLPAKPHLSNQIDIWLILEQKFQQHHVLY